MTSIAVATVRPARFVRGRVRLAGDKSISHRYALLAALASGRSTISRYAPGADCAATLSCLRALGVEAQMRIAPAEAGTPVVEIVGRGLRGLRAPTGPVDARNSGTTMRLLAGVLAAHPFEATLIGDASLGRRPMQRVIEPLERMGARIESDRQYPPLTVHGGSLHAIDFSPPVPSAQVKSAVLLAGLQAQGRTRISEPAPTRNHTEIALRVFGAEVRTAGGAIEIDGGQPLRGVDVVVPGDISSGAFWAVAASALPGSDVELVDVGLNPTRIALLDVLRAAGAHVEVAAEREDGGEPRGRVRIRFATLRPLVLGAADVPGLIDELPALAAWATHGGHLRVTGAAELRVKESDRIGALVRGMRALGADVDELPDGFEVRGSRRLAGGRADAAGDHRLAMAFAIAALGAESPSVIAGADSVAISYPDFFPTLESLVA
jgi:3-phosphoshikimate 1-carboxyvinyltransferase